MAKQTLTVQDIQTRRKTCQENFRKAQQMLFEAQRVMERNAGAMTLLDQMEQQLTGKKNGKKTKKAKRKTR